MQCDSVANSGQPSTRHGVKKHVLAFLSKVEKQAISEMNQRSFSCSKIEVSIRFYRDLAGKTMRLVIFQNMFVVAFVEMQKVNVDDIPTECLDFADTLL